MNEEFKRLVADSLIIISFRIGICGTGIGHMRFLLEEVYEAYINENTVDILSNIVELERAVKNDGWDFVESDYKEILEHTQKIQHAHLKEKE